MVFTGVPGQPSQWPYYGYHEIQKPRRKNVLIDYEKMVELLSVDNYDQVRRDHQGWSAALSGNGNGQEDKCAKSIAVGDKEFVDEAKSRSGFWLKEEPWRKRGPALNSESSRIPVYIILSPKSRWRV